MRIRLGTALVAATGLLLGPLALAASATLTPHATTPVMGSYVPVTPFRITDTRANSGQPNAGKTLAAAATLNVQVTGLGTVPAGASAAVLNVTAVNPTAAGFLTVFPAGIAMPTVSNLNFTPGVIVANLVTVPLSAAGMVSIFNHAGNTNVVVDVDGYYTSTPSTNGTGLYNSMSPVRALGNLQLGAPVAANTSVPVTVTGTLTGVPATATAVVVNVTAAHGTAPSYLTVYPAGAASVPTASSVNFIAGQAIANRVTVGVGLNGQIEVYNHTGTVNVDVDVNGYYSGVGGTGSAFVPITPVRITDTRGTTPLNGTPIAANTSESFNLTTALSTVPATATSVAANVTAVAGNARGYLTVYPTSAATHPVASDVNWVAKEIVPNFTIADTAGTGSVEVYNSAGATVSLLIDVFGYFAAASNGPIMVSAAVTSTTIAITYNEAVVCPSLAGAQAEFVYDWTGAASGGAIAGVTCVGDVLTLTGVFTLPGNTGGSITYTAPAVNGAVSVSATSNGAFAATQTISVTAAVVPAMVSAVWINGTTIQITYNENVLCAGAFGDFVYYYTGVSSAVPTAIACGANSNVLTLTGTFTAPAADATLKYTVPTLGNTIGTSVYATGTTTDFAATQTLTSSQWAPPAMASAVVTATSIAITYNENVSCAVGAVTEAEFAYYAAGTTSGITTLTNAGCAGAVLTLTGTFTLPGTGASIVYTAPASPTVATAVSATTAYPQFAVTQTLALAALPIPAITAAVSAGGATLTVTYSENVSCPATGADGDFVYDSAFNTLGGSISGCTAANNVLTLSGIFNPATAAASLVYTAPAVSTTANAVVAAGSTSAFAATQTFFPVAP